MGVRAMFPPSSVKPLSQYAPGANIGPRKTGFGPLKGDEIAVCSTRLFHFLQKSLVVFTTQ